jgi:hypothetical protein
VQSHDPIHAVRNPLNEEFDKYDILYLRSCTIVKRELGSCILTKFAFPLRLLIMAGLVVLLLGLFIPLASGSTVGNFLFQSQPPSQSSPPVQSSPPHGKPGVGIGMGTGGVLQLTYVDNDWVQAPDASGKIKIWEPYREDHPKYTGWPPAIDYTVWKLPCQDFGFNRINWREDGRWFYVLYLRTETSGMKRLQSFNPGCPDKTFVSWLVVPDIDEEVLANEDLLFEVYLHKDSYYGPYGPILRGELIRD